MINYAVAQRLRLIEFLLKNYGTVGRIEIADYFGVSLPQATRDFKQYSQLAPGNALYNKTSKRWVKSDTFKAVFNG